MHPDSAPTTVVAETGRLRLRQLRETDAEFILALLNEPSFLRFIGDKGVRTIDQAKSYIQNGPVASYARNGYGLNLVQEKETGAPIGMCGLVRRDWLEGPDLGFALLPAFWSRGFAFEAATAVLQHAAAQGHSRILAITDPVNRDSIRLLERLGFTTAGSIRNPEGEDLNLFARLAGP